MMANRRPPPLKTYDDFRRLCNRHRCGSQTTPDEYVAALEHAMRANADNFIAQHVLDGWAMQFYGQKFLVRKPTILERELLGTAALMIRSADGTLTPISAAALQELLDVVFINRLPNFELASSYAIEFAALRNDWCYRVGKDLGFC
jgi:hypothetical protein